MAGRAAACLLLCGLAGGHASAAVNDRTSLAWVQHPGAMLPPDTRVTDADGRAGRLGDVFGRVPVILDLDYYHCPSLCGVVRADVINALANSGLASGRDYRFLSLSIDPRETPADAAAARKTDLAQASFADPASWRYVVATAAGIDTVADIVGFRDRYDAVLKQFIHPAGVVVLTKAGRVSSYLLGVGYSAGDMRAAVLRAGDGGIAQAALPILLLCFHFDPNTGRYTLAIVKLLKLLAAITIVTIGGLLFLLSRRSRPA
jgi:protein SCO1/2